MLTSNFFRFTFLSLQRICFQLLSVLPSVAALPINSLHAFALVGAFPIFRHGILHLGSAPLPSDD